jgi:multisubunit Na+/H+ antiporter MnhB subunit
MFVFAVYLLLRGHSAPGGGFAGALVAGTAFALFAIVEGSGTVRKAVRLSPQQLMASGLGIAVFSALAGPISGSAFMKGVWWSVSGSAGSAIFGSPLVFDVGVFFTVLGAILTLLLTLEEL